MALSADTRPHFTTIANFISSLDQEVVQLFRDILLVCDEMGLVGKEMFALDGCKLPSNASKEWSGTRADFEKKCKKLEHAIQAMIDNHRELDLKETDHELISREKKYIESLKKQVKKIRDWMDNNDDKPGRGGGIRKSNIPRLCILNALERDFF
ncbi:Mobile element protein [Dissulfuribacter thermophilus]|uniref:Mobile element protein n=2 Tax=Dissulfuribacter thermophilus TaxID=1156395 RepID=A0A1B9F8X0_9BACT|nr:Mobile element protein [Dissulfuribacter thermophilus]